MADLQRGIELAQAGQRDDARAILRQVVAESPDSEMGWLWLATVAADRIERVDALRRVISINPENTTARDALDELGETIAAVEPSEVDAEEEKRNPLSPLEIGGIVVAVLIVAFIVIFIASSLEPETPEPPPPITMPPTDTATPRISSTPSDTPRPTRTEGPSPTPLTLPPSWTPTDTPTERATRTLAPTSTPIPSRTLPPSATDTFTPVPSVTPSSTNTPMPTETEEPRTATETPTLPDFNFVTATPRDE